MNFFPNCIWFNQKFWKGILFLLNFTKGVEFAMYIPNKIVPNFESSVKF